MTIVFQKSLLKSKAAKRIVRDGMLAYFKEKVLEHLDALEAKEKKRERVVQKALIEAECLRKAAYPVGTIREWKGKKYIKTAPGKWRRKYDKEGKGAKIAIAALKKKVDACKTSEELYQLVMAHSDRFRDENGHPLPIVQELSEYVSKANDRLEGRVHFIGGSKGATKKEIKAFLANAVNTDEKQTLSFGLVEYKARMRIKKILKKDVELIIVDSDAVRHAMSEKKHRIKLEDLEKVGEIVNTTRNISLSNQRHLSNVALRFVEEAEDGLNLIVEFRSGKGNLALVTAYRKEKKEKTRRNDATMRNTAPARTSETFRPSLVKENISEPGSDVKQGKKDILGNVSEDSLKQKGISGNAARLIMSLYDAAGDAPLQDTPEARRAYVRGLSALRDKLEGAKTDADVEDALRDIDDDLRLFSYRMKLPSTEESKKLNAAFEEAERERDEHLARLHELAHKKDKESRAAEGRVYKQVKEYLVENGAMYEFEGLKDEYDRERYAERLPSDKKGEYDKFFDGIYKKEEAELNEKLAKLNAEIKSEDAAYKEAKEKASKAESELDKWADKQTKAMANADPLYEGWVQLGKKFREAVERERANLIHRAFRL